MKLKVKDMNIATGGPFIAVLSEEDASKLDLHHEDRIRIKHRKTSVTAIIDISESKKTVPKGKIGLFEEILKALKVKSNSTVEISTEEKPKSIEAIKKKLDGVKLTAKDIDMIVEDIVKGKLTDIELTYFVAACYTYIFDNEETVALTKSMIKHGDLLKLKGKYVADKHCIGGVAGNRTTMLIVPIVAAAGVLIPKTSSRSITSPAGTADTMEVLSKVTIPIERMKKIIEKTNSCLVWGGAIDLAPADDKIIRVEYPLSIDSRSQLLASILAKKASVSATHVLVDIPIGLGAKILHKKNAVKLGNQFKRIGKEIGMEIKYIITDGSQPIGNGLGPALEARDVLWVLRNDKKMPLDLRKKSVMMAGLIIEMVGKAPRGRGEELALEILESGKAYKKFIEIVKAQGGKEMLPGQIKLGRYKHHVKAAKKGKIVHIDNTRISHIARISGAPKDKGAGVYLHEHKGTKVKKGALLFTIHSNSRERLKFAVQTQKEMPAFIIN